MPGTAPCSVGQPMQPLLTPNTADNRRKHYAPSVRAHVNAPRKKKYDRKREGGPAAPVGANRGDRPDAELVAEGRGEVAAVVPEHVVPGQHAPRVRARRTWRGGLPGAQSLAH